MSMFYFYNQKKQNPSFLEEKTHHQQDTDPILKEVTL